MIISAVDIDNVLYYKMINGPILNKLIPWHNKIKDAFTGLNYVDLSYQINFGSIPEHIDPIDQFDVKDQFNAKSEPGLKLCKINYIISSDFPDSKTIVYDRDSDQTEFYPSTVGGSWLLDVTKPHEVIGNGTREIASFKFYNTFSEVKNYMKMKDPIIF
jgi:hypothetical protein